MSEKNKYQLKDLQLVDNNFYYTPKLAQRANNKQITFFMKKKQTFFPIIFFQIHFLTFLFFSRMSDLLNVGGFAMLF